MNHDSSRSRGRGADRPAHRAQPSRRATRSAATAVPAVLAFATLFTLLAGCNEASRPRTEPDRPSVFVVNGLGETLSRIDLEDGSVQNDVVTLGSAAANVFPNDIEISHDGTRGYVTNSGENSIQILDLSAVKSLGFVPLGTGQSPFASVLVGATSLFATNLVSGQVAEVDLVNRVVTQRIPVGRGPEGILALGDRLYVANTNFDSESFSYGQGSISIIDRTVHEEVKRIPVGRNPQDILLDHQGRIDVMCTGDYDQASGWIYVIDPNGDTLLDSVRVGGYPSEMALAGADKIYIAEQAVLYSFRPSTRTLLRDESNPIRVGTGSLFSVDYDATEMRAYVAEFQTDKVWVVDAEADTVITSKNVGDGPVRVRVRRAPVAPQ